MKSETRVMPVPDQVRDDGSGIQNILILLDSGFRRWKIPMPFAGNDGNTKESKFYEVIKTEATLENT
jgi:hypothetical protein